MSDTKSESKSRSLGLFLSVVIAVFLIYGVGWQWIICRIYVAPGELMYVTAKTGKENINPDVYRVVESGTKGIQEKIYGEGRYFINPILNERSIMPMVTPVAQRGYLPYDAVPGYVSAREVGVVKSLSGENLPSGEFLVEPGQNKKGILRHALTPGVWRLNPKAYEIKLEKAVVIEPGHVGCVISLSGKNPTESRLAQEGERGVMEKVLQPGIYFFNPTAYRVQTVPINYRETYFPKINFKSKDGFDIEVDVSVVWGVLPAKVPQTIDRVGNIDDVSDKIIKLQVESLCRIEGSKYGAVELIEGISREKFQNNFTDLLLKICEEKDIRILLGLIRNIIIPQEIRDPIQKSKIAVEEMKTKKELQETQKVLNQLEKLKQEVVKGVQEVQANTERAVATILADGQKQVAEIQAQKQVDVALLQKEVADIEALTTRLLGEAKAKAQELKRRAEADRLVQNVQAMGGAEEYTLYTFAQKLSDKLQIAIRHTGPGTFWTDLPGQFKDLEKVAAAKIMQREEKENK
jgi:regulator of protease activity HflC (stomatin/prohibitin superfamily)